MEAVSLSCHFSSLRLDWQTPPEVLSVLSAEFLFDFDPCPHNPDYDGLSISWGRCNFVNPPYGREIGKWLAKGFTEWHFGKTSVFLIPSRTDTSWWHEYCMKATEIRFVRGRIKFGGAKHGAPFPSAVVIFASPQDSPETVDSGSKTCQVLDKPCF